MLSIIIINYRSAQLLIDCLQTLHAGNGEKDFEIIIVDNSPGDGAKEQVLPSYPKLTWISMGYNAGFARANNYGIKAAKGDAVLLLNPDTLVIDDAVTKAYKALLGSTYAGCGVQLLNEDGSPQISGNFVMKGGLNYLMQVPYLGRLVRKVALSAGVSKTNLPEAKKPVTTVDWINGAFLMVKKTAINHAGFLDEDFFLYHEESEWCNRLKKAGGLCILGDLHVTHLEGQAANKAFESSTSGYSGLSDKKGYQLMLSMFVRIRKEFGAGWFLFHLFFYLLSAPLVYISAFLHAVISCSVQPLKTATGFNGNVFRCSSFVFKILSNKPYFYKVL